MGAVGTKVIFYALIVTDLHENITEYTAVGILMKRRKQTALKHILHNPHGFKASGLSTGIRARHDKNAAVLSQGNI